MAGAALTRTFVVAVFGAMVIAPALVVPRITVATILRITVAAILRVVVIAALRASCFEASSRLAVVVPAITVIITARSPAIASVARSSPPATEVAVVLLVVQGVRPVLSILVGQLTSKAACKFGEILGKIPLVVTIRRVSTEVLKERLEVVCQVAIYGLSVCDSIIKRETWPTVAIGVTSLLSRHSSCRAEDTGQGDEQEGVLGRDHFGLLLLCRCGLGEV